MKRLAVCLSAVCLVSAAWGAAARGQAPAAGPEPAKRDVAGSSLPLEEFRPRSMLAVQEHRLARAKFPVVDVHVHPRFRLRGSAERLDEFVKLMDAQNIAVCVSLDGGLGEQLEEHKKFLWTKYPDRWVIFANIDWRGGGKADEPATWDCQRPDFGRRMAEALAEAKRAGASGLKVFKDLGLVYRNPDGSLVRVDDPRWDPIWRACGELGLPVLIHTADPKAFFLPIDATNERWEELKRHPDWSFHGPGFPKYEELVAQFLAVVERHPRTRFIGAHVASSAEDLGHVERWLAKYPNLTIDIAARIGELGRQPYTARKFFVKHADRILFGTDGPRVAERLESHWRFLETLDEYFPYAENPFPPQGFWRIYGVGLPDEVLRKVYYENAERLIPGVRERYEKYVSGAARNAPLREQR
jgi:predicted TIM-barrel fold metal-dependent hydrolase